MPSAWESVLGMIWLREIKKQERGDPNSNGVRPSKKSNKTIKIRPKTPIYQFKQVALL